MVKNLLCCIIPGMVLAMFAGCASTVKNVQEQSLLPEIDIVQLKENSDEALKVAQEAKLDVQMANAKIAELDNRLVVLSEEVSSVSLAKIEEIENRLALLVEAFKDLQQSIATIEVIPRVGAPKKNAPAVAEAPTFSPSSAANLVTSTEYETYQTALRTYNTRSYDVALKQFSELIEKYPNSTYVPNAYYWVGECHYALGKYAEGIASFDKVLGFSQSPKADDAQLKIGMCYLRMGKKSQAKESLNLLINRFPASEYVPRAKKYLADLN